MRERKGNDSSPTPGPSFASEEVSRKEDLDREIQIKGKGGGDV